MVNKHFFWILIITLGVGVLLTKTGYPLNWEEKPYGYLTILPMTTAPYPDDSRKKGLTIGTTFYSYEEHYDNNSVAIIK